MHVCAERGTTVSVFVGLTMPSSHRLRVNTEPRLRVNDPVFVVSGPCALYHLPHLLMITLPLHKGDISFISQQVESLLLRNSAKWLVGHYKRDSRKTTSDQAQTGYSSSVSGPFLSVIFPLSCDALQHTGLQFQLLINTYCTD